MSAMRLLLVAYLALKTAHEQKKNNKKQNTNPQSLSVPVPTLYQRWQAVAATLSAAIFINKFNTSSTVRSK